MGIRSYFARHIRKHIDVYRIDDFTLEPPEIHGLEHHVNVTHIEPSMTVNVISWTSSVKMKCKASGRILQERRVNAKSYLVKRYVKQNVKAYSHDVKSKLKTYDAMKLIRDMPLELSDMLKYQSVKPKLLNNEMLLAWYGPIVEGAVIKLVWNKQRGTLLVWYNPQSRQFKAKGVYLIRRLGFGAKPEWRWV